MPILHRFGSAGSEVVRDGKYSKNYRTLGWLVSPSGLEPRLALSVWRSEYLQLARAVGRDDEENVYASKINMRLMSGMFGSNIGGG